MAGKVRWLLVGLVVASALALTGPSFGAVTPRLVVSAVADVSGQTLTINASKQKADDPLARIQFFVPTGFALNSPAPGRSVGTATARVILRDSDPTHEQPMAGTVTAIAPTDSRIAYEGSTCDASQHLAAWLVQLKSSKATVAFPVYVDASSGDSTAWGPYVLVACFRSPDLAASDPNRSPGGAILDAFTLDLNPFDRPTTAGEFRWRSLWTPYTVGTGTLNTAGNVEAQSLVVIPTGQIVIFGKRANKTVQGKTVFRLQISGQVLVQSEPVGPVVVTVRHGAGKDHLVSLGAVHTGGDGGYTIFARLAKGPQYYQAAAYVPPKDLGPSGCEASFPNTPCLSATSGAGRVVSGLMLVRPK
jgi:hypothetical protein